MAGSTAMNSYQQTFANIFGGHSCSSTSSSALGGTTDFRTNGTGTALRTYGHNSFFWVQPQPKYPAHDPRANPDFYPGSTITTKRHLSPVKPKYQLPSIPTGPAQSQAQDWTQAPLSRSLDTSDISGPHLRSLSNPPRNTRCQSSLDVHDIVAPQRKLDSRPLTSLSTEDIEGAKVRPRTRNSVSPGRGTLYNADIPGSSPGRTRPLPISASVAASLPNQSASAAVLRSYSTGRWPQPSPPKFHFDKCHRKTVLQKPNTSFGN